MKRSQRTKKRNRNNSSGSPLLSAKSGNFGKSLTLTYEQLRRLAPGLIYGTKLTADRRGYTEIGLEPPGDVLIRFEVYPPTAKEPYPAILITDDQGQRPWRKYLIGRGDPPLSHQATHFYGPAVERVTY